MSRAVIIGAGPYALAAAASLRAAGVKTKVFGEPMGFWKRNMPAGMLLRSPRGASNIGDPDGAYSIDAYHAARGTEVPHPVPLERFVDYGVWFAQQCVREVDPRQITRVVRDEKGFLLTPSEGSLERAEHVVVAAGIEPFARRPEKFRALPPGMVSHACDHSSFSEFDGKHVAVMGGGQSALEYAALLSEAGAEVELIARTRKIRWLRGGSGSKLHAVLHSSKNPLRSLMFPRSNIGPPVINYLVDKPYLFNGVPTRALRDWIAKVAIRPAGSGWLPARMRSVSFRTGVSVVNATPNGNGLHLETSDGSRQKFDHLLLATGYAVDLAKYQFLTPEIVGQIRTIEGYPQLNRYFGSSVPGLHFLGAPAAKSFGPLMRFVAGSGYAARRVTEGIC
jgi:NADPH-dependent 2,4-dienoyl-CoA reductase/sulfur reductase-like enzyme